MSHQGLNIDDKSDDLPRVHNYAKEFKTVKDELSNSYFLRAALNVQVPYKNAVSIAAKKEFSEDFNNTANRLSCEQEDGAVLNTDKEILANNEDSMDSIQNPGVSDMQFNFSHYLLNSEVNAVLESDKPAERSPVYTEPLKNAIQEQVIKHISHSVSNGQRELVIELKPEFLGKVNIRLVAEKDGVVAKIKTSNSELREVLDISASQIQESLKSQGIEMKNFELSGFEENTYSDFLGFNENRRHQEQRENKPMHYEYFSGKEKDNGDAVYYEETWFASVLTILLRCACGCRINKYKL